MSDEPAVGQAAGPAITVPPPGLRERPGCVAQESRKIGAVRLRGAMSCGPAEGLFR
jgi:hypothetical protein